MIIYDEEVREDRGWSLEWGMCAVMALVVCGMV